MSLQTKTYTQLYTLVKALYGSTSLTTEEDTLLGAFINRRLYNAYRRSDLWPRYLVVGEARVASGNVIPFTQATLNTIDTFLRVYSASPYDTQSVDEFDLNVTSSGARVVGNSSDASTFYVDYKKVWDGPFDSTSNTLIPLEHFEYAAHGAYSDLLRYDKQQDKALLADQEAEQLLMLELANPMLQRTAQVAGRRIRTYNTKQSR